MNIEYEDNEEETQRTNQKIGEVMIGMKLITREDLEDALIEQEIARRQGEEVMIGYMLVEMGVITNLQLIEVYREYKRRLQFSGRKRRKGQDER